LRPPGRRCPAAGWWRSFSHLYSRTRDFAESFGAPAAAWRRAPICGAGAPIPGVRGGIVAEAQRRGHAAIEAVDGMDAALGRLEELLEAGDVLLTLGAGDVHRIAESWLGARP
jgi:UDP-N-acetylmuramate--alanine ligase